MAIRIQKRRGTAAAWTAANPILADGEEGYESDTKKLKIGDGVTAWSALSYRVSDPASVALTGGTMKNVLLGAKLRAARDAARNNNVFDLGLMSSPPTVTTGAAALASPVSYNYFDVGGYKRIRMMGVPFGDTSVMCENVAGAFRGMNLNSPGVFANNLRGYKALVKFTGQTIQFNVNGLSAAIIRIQVNNQLVSLTPTTVGASNIQLAFGARGTYEIGLEFERAVTVTGVSVDQDDTVYSVETPPIPIVGLGDSYLEGIMSVGAGYTAGQNLGAAIREIGGFNFIAQGISGSGYVTAPVMTDSSRLTFAANAINAANAPLVCLLLGTNDLAASSASITSAAQAVITYLLANTNAKVAVFDPWPKSLNLSASLLAASAAVQAAAAAFPTSRTAYVPMNTASAPWVTGTKSTATSSGVAGNSRTVTGDDGTHPSVEGAPYLARKVVDSLIATCETNGW